jgi:probable F420-dependent oxidoreductase
LVMHIGVVFPSIELGGDRSAIRDWIQVAESVRYHHILVYEHVLGFAESPDPSYYGPISPDLTMHEPLVFLGFLAGLTCRVELFTGVLVLPMRQTVSVAKQTAEIDALSGGRLRLGVGVGHVEREFQALDQDYHTRGRRIEEQIELLRALWVNETLTFHGRWHQLVQEAGLLGPRPVQRPIPLWLGGASNAAMARAARVADGWFPVLLQPDDCARGLITQFWSGVEEAGRSKDQVGVNTLLPLRSVATDRWSDTADAWRALGVTHLTVECERAGLDSARAHVDALKHMHRAVKDAV